MALYAVNIICPTSSDGVPTRPLLNRQLLLDPSEFTFPNTAAPASGPEHAESASLARWLSKSPSVDLCTCGLLTARQSAAQGALCGSGKGTKAGDCTVEVLSNLWEHHRCQGLAKAHLLQLSIPVPP